jgi:hypothetical protein
MKMLSPHLQYQSIKLLFINLFHFNDLHLHEDYEETNIVFNERIFVGIQQMTTIPAVIYVGHHSIFILNWIQDQVIQFFQSLANGKLVYLLIIFKILTIKLELLDFFFCKKLIISIVIYKLLVWIWYYACIDTQKVFKYYTNRIENCLLHFSENPLTLLFSQWNFFVLVFFLPYYMFFYSVKQT